MDLAWARMMLGIIELSNGFAEGFPASTTPENRQGKARQKGPGKRGNYN
jgi:hypothetical protein